MTQKNAKLKVLFVSAEVAPYAKTGGLADVAGSLPVVLSEAGIDVRVAMPKYRQIDGNSKYVTDFPVSIDGRVETCIIRRGKMNNKVPIYFVDSYNYFDRDGIYCFMDDAQRFAFFCKAILKMLPNIGFKPDVIHLNDWHTGPVSMLLKESFADNDFYKNIKTIFTIHNLKYQGNFPKEIINLFDAGESVFIPEKTEFYGTFSFMKTGIVYSDIVNTVSNVYAKEIQTKEYGEGMEGILQKREEDLYGILNGISYDEFNPKTDIDIYKNYDSENLEDKKYNKTKIQKELGLKKSDVPLLGIVTRLSGQKGLDLIIDKIEQIISKCQLVVLGTGEPYYETAFTELKNKYPDKISLNIEFNAGLAKKIYAGSDMFLMPSRFEPCGLGQLISLQYGTIPIVRETGGLAETVIDYDKDPINGTGFTFKDFNMDEFYDAVERAVKLYNKKALWNELVKKGMGKDLSWEMSAKKYIDLYKKANSHK